MTAATARYTREQALADLAAVYARLPGLLCKGRCADACTVIDGSELERTLLAEAGRPLPPRMTHRQHLELIAAGRGPRCPALGPLRTCTVYEVRPMICRLFGLIGKLRADDPPDPKAALACDHGCVPERWLTEAEGFELLAAADEISARWVRAGRP